MTTIERMTTAELVAEYNRLNPDKPVKRFSDRATAVKRVYAALGQQSSGFPPAETPAPAPESNAAEQTASTPAPAVEAPAKPSAKPRKVAGAKAEKPAAKPRATKAAYKAAKDGKEPRPESKRGQLLAILRGPGITIEAMQAKFEWKALDCRDALRLLGKQNGVATELRGDGRWYAK